MCQLAAEFNFNNKYNSIVSPDSYMQIWNIYPDIWQINFFQFSFFLRLLVYLMTEEKLDLQLRPADV